MTGKPLLSQIYLVEANLPQAILGEFYNLHQKPLVFN